MHNPPLRVGNFLKTCSNVPLSLLEHFSSFATKVCVFATKVYVFATKVHRLRLCLRRPELAQKV